MSSLDPVAELLRTEFALERTSIDAILAEVTQTGESASRIAERRGLLNASQADVLDTLEHPNDILPDYEFLGLLGRGAMGVVYRARQKSLDRLVAIKTVMLGPSRTNATLSRFEHEGKTIARLRHPNIVAAHDLHQRAGRMYLVMELLEGQPLDDWLTGRGPLDEFVAWWLIRQTAAALGHAAEQHVVHRDIKPSNLFVLPPPSGFPLPPGVPLVKLTDFGLAMLKQSEELDATRLTQNGMTVGTPTYMAPEQIESSDVDHRADIYALGCTAFRMLTGTQPFAGTMLQVITQKTNRELPRVTDVAPTISSLSADLVAFMTRRDPQERLSSYDDLLRRIDEILEGNAPNRQTKLKTSARPADATVTFDALPDSSSKVFSPRKRWQTATLIVVALLVSVGAAVPFLKRGKAVVAFDRRAVPTANGTALFDGQEVASWRTAARGSLVAIANDGEGGRVLEIKGTVARRLPKTEFFEIEMHVDLRRARTLALTFGATPEGTSNSATITHTTVSMARETTDHSATAVTTKPLTSDPWADSTSETPTYVVVKLERQPAGWGLFLSNDLIGALPLVGAHESEELRISVEGTAAFEEVTFTELIVPAMQPRAVSANNAHCLPLTLEAGRSSTSILKLGIDGVAQAARATDAARDCGA